MYDINNEYPSTTINQIVLITKYYVTATSVTTSSLKGDWLQHGLPFQMVLNSYSITYVGIGLCVEQFPSSCYILGSNDNVNWYL